MCGHHHSIGLFLAHPEFGLEHRDNELPRRVVIVDQDDLVKARSFSFRSDLMRGLVAASFIERAG